jgi:hypothetical protein
MTGDWTGLVSVTGRKVVRETAAERAEDEQAKANEELGREEGF